MFIPNFQQVSINNDFITFNFIYGFFVMVSNIFTFVSIFLFFSSSFSLLSLPASSLTENQNTHTHTNWLKLKLQIKTLQKQFNKIANRTKKNNQTQQHMSLTKICAHTKNYFTPDTCSFVCKISPSNWNIFCEFENWNCIHMLRTTNKLNCLRKQTKTKFV